MTTQCFSLINNFTTSNIISQYTECIYIRVKFFVSVWQSDQNMINEMIGNVNKHCKDTANKDWFQLAGWRSTKITLSAELILDFSLLDSKNKKCYLADKLSENNTSLSKDCRKICLYWDHCTSSLFSHLTPRQRSVTDFTFLLIDNF